LLVVVRFAYSNITPVEERLKPAALTGGAPGIANLGGICPKQRSGRESSQHPRRFPPRSTNDTLPAQFARPAEQGRFVVGEHGVAPRLVARPNRST
jgi:hypothetical protein